MTATEVRVELAWQVGPVPGPRAVPGALGGQAPPGALGVGAEPGWEQAATAEGPRPTCGLPPRPGYPSSSH